MTNETYVFVLLDEKREPMKQLEVFAINKEKAWEAVMEIAKRTDGCQAVVSIRNDRRNEA